MISNPFLFKIVSVCKYLTSAVTNPQAGKIRQFKQVDLLQNFNMFNTFCFDLTLKLNINLNRKCYFLNLDKINMRRSKFTPDLRKSQNKPDSQTENFEFLVFSFSDENLKYVHDYLANYEVYLKEPKKLRKILESKIYGNSHSADFLHSESLNQKKYINHFKIKMNLIIKKMEQDQLDLKNGVKSSPSEVIVGMNWLFGPKNNHLKRDMNERRQCL